MGTIKNWQNCVVLPISYQMPSVRTVQGESVVSRYISATRWLYSWPSSAEGTATWRNMTVPGAAEVT